MSGLWYLWISMFFALMAGFLVCVKTAGNGRRHAIYFISGAVLGFYFDFVSLASGFYAYPSIYPLAILGIPVTMTIAEGFSVSITMRAAEITRSLMTGGKK